MAEAITDRAPVGSAMQAVSQPAVARRAATYGEAMVERPEVPAAIVTRVRRICLDLPEAREEPAWVGTRWRIRTKTFAHVVQIDRGWPPAYAEAAGSAGPLTVLTFRAEGDELDAFGRLGPPFFRPVWFADIVGMAIDAGTDWAEVAELLTDSYCLLAPRKLADQVARPEA
jgi:YjbR protein